MKLTKRQLSNVIRGLLKEALPKPGEWGALPSRAQWKKQLADEEIKQKMHRQDDDTDEQACKSSGCPVDIKEVPDDEIKCYLAPQIYELIKAGDDEKDAKEMLGWRWKDHWVMYLPHDLEWDNKISRRPACIGLKFANCSK